MMITKLSMPKLRNNLLILYKQIKKSPLKEEEVQQKLFELGKKYGETWVSKKIFRVCHKYKIHPLQALAFICRTSQTSLVREYCNYLLTDQLVVSEESKIYTRKQWVEKLNELYYDY
jgi:hypothetical protein